MSEGTIQLSPFVRIEEYKAILADVANATTRRQTVTALYATLNTAFLGAFGYLILTLGLSSWLTIIVLGSLSFTILPLNLAWFVTMLGYRRGLRTRYAYLRSIEEEFRAYAATTEKQGQIGLIHQLQRNSLPGRSLPETLLAIYFVVIYAIAVIIASLLTWLVSNQVIPPIRFL